MVNEAGQFHPDPRGSIAVIACLAVPRLRDLGLAVHHVRKRLSPRLRDTPEFKFSRSSEKARLRMLYRLARLESLELDLTLVDPRRLSPVVEPVRHYFAAVAETVSRVRRRHPGLCVLIDKRFTKPRTQEALSTAIRTAGRYLPGPFKVQHADSQKTVALQAADFVAGAFFHRHARQVPEYAEVVSKRVVTEVWFEGK